MFSGHLDSRLAGWGILLIRIAVGVVFFMHGLDKLFISGVDDAGGFFGSLGIPAPTVMATVIGIIELVGGAALILGAAVRLVGIIFALDMLVALLTVHLPNGFFVMTGGYELVFALGLAALGLALTGSGPLGLDNMLDLPGNRRRQHQPARA